MKMLFGLKMEIFFFGDPIFKVKICILD